MPVGIIKNALYHMALPVLGKKCEWKPAGEGFDRKIQSVLYRYHVVGASIQTFRKGQLSEYYCVGKAGEGREVSKDTVFRSASLAKTITALLVFRLQSLGKLNIKEDISAFWKTKIRNPTFSEQPISLAMLMSHTSSICDFPGYFASFEKKTPLSVLLNDPKSFTANRPGTQFCYSNFAAGMIGSLLEYRFGESIENLAQEFLFHPCGIQASYDLFGQSQELLSDSYRVMPSTFCFSARSMINKAQQLTQPDYEKHYLLTSGNVFLTAGNLAKLGLLAWNGGNGLLDPHCLCLMKTPVADWPEKQICIHHGPGLFQIDDQSVYPELLWGHQGLAYGAVNGLFFDSKGNGFSILTSGASEERKAHLTRLNLELIHLLLGGKHGQDQ